MKIKLNIQSVAVKQLESAIWMYAYDYDEVAVHTIAGAAFELYTTRLAKLSFMNEMKKTLEREKFNDFKKVWNKPYNFFKHGSSSHEKIDEIVYDELLVEPLIYMSCVANMQGDEAFRLNCSMIFMNYFHTKHAEWFNDTEQLDAIKKVEETGLTKEEIISKKTLQVWLKMIDHTFVNGSSTPFRDINHT